MPENKGENKNNKNRKSEFDLAVAEILDFITQSSKEDQTEELQNQSDLKSELAYRQKMRDEQEKRTEEITQLFVNYRKQQSERYDYKCKTKPQFVHFLFGLIIAIGLVFVIFLLAVLGTQDLNGADIAMIITGFVTCLGSILSILLIIVKYLFPEDEDKDFNDLIKSIITNDTVRIKDDNTYQIDNKKNNNKKDG